MYGDEAGMRVARKPERAAAKSVRNYFRNGQADLAALRSLAPLPESEDEIREMARVFGSGPADIFVRARASESWVKQLSASSQLARYRIVAFAAHGLVAGDLQGVAEPAIALTVPSAATRDDDGLLTASEISSLKFDADFVILSACNTAAGDAAGSDALSGLARAFLYAGARSLLVSHWPVDSDAAVKLTTRMVAIMKEKPEISKAGALRLSMLEMIDNGEPRERHPDIWAPFFVFGASGGSERPVCAYRTQPSRTVPAAT